MENKTMDFEKVKKFMDLDLDKVVRKVKKLDIPDTDQYKELVNKLIVQYKETGALTFKQKRALCMSLAQYSEKE